MNFTLDAAGQGYNELKPFYCIADPGIVNHPSISTIMMYLV